MKSYPFASMLAPTEAAATQLPVYGSWFPPKVELPLSPEYAVATVNNPTSALTDFTLMIDLSNLPADWWTAVDTSDGTKGRAAKDWDGEQLACDWIDFDDVAKTGFLRVKWSGSLASTGTQKIRVYPPKAANRSAEAHNEFGQYAAYDDDWGGYWPTDADFDDRTGNGVDGTGAGGIAAGGVTGQVGPGTNFDGSNDYIDLEQGGSVPAAIQAGTGAITVMAWIKDGASGERAVAVGTNAAKRYELWNSGGRLYFTIDDGSTKRQAISSAAYATGAYQHAVGRRAADGSLEVFLNGSSAGTAVGHSGDLDEDTFARIGQLGDGGTGTLWSGELDDVQIHAVERSDDWIAHEHSQTNDNASFWGTWDWAPDGIVYVPTQQYALRSKGWSTAAETIADAQLGEAAADRIILVGIHTTQGTVTGVTIGGTSATLLAKPSAGRLSIYYLAVAAGTEADIVISIGTGPEYVGAQIGALYGAASSEDNYQAEQFSYDPDPRSFTTDPSIPTDGIGLVFVSAAHAILDFGGTGAVVFEDEIAVGNLVSMTLAVNNRDSGTWALSWTGASYVAGSGVAVGWAPAGAGGGASIAGAASVGVSASATLRARAGLVGAAPFSISAAGNTIHARGALSGAPSLALAATATLRARAALVGAVEFALSSTGTLGGASSILGTATFGFSITGALRASAALAGSLPMTLSAAANLHARADLAGAVGLLLATAATPHARGDLEGTAGMLVNAAASARGRGNLTGATSLLLTAAADLRARASLSGTSAFLVNATGTLALSGGTSMIGLLTMAFPITGTLRARGTMEGSAPISVAATATPHGRADLTGAATVGNISTSAALRGRGILGGIANAAVSTVGSIRARASLVGSPVVTLGVTGALRAAARLSGTAVMQILASGSMVLGYTHTVAYPIGGRSKRPIAIHPTQSPITLQDGTPVIEVKPR